MTTIDEAIDRAREMAELTKQTLPDSSKEHQCLMEWLLELKGFQTNRRRFSGQGISICILTYNVLFYNKLALRQIRAMTRLVPYEILILDNGSTDGSVEWLEQQPDVRVVQNKTKGQLRHGTALDYLVRNVAMYPIICTLCSDAFPTSVEWVTPSFYLDSETVLAGVGRGCGRITQDYVCPSFLFGWTSWLKNHSFCDKWPRTDTGEQLTKDCLDEGKKIKLWQAIPETGDGLFSPKRCNYANLVWHVWWGGRSQSVPSLVGIECEANYQERMKAFLRKKHNLDF